MSRPGYADRARLQSWADARASHGELPRLIRRLILETAPGIAALGMPAGEGVAAAGWDGSVHASSASPWVPAGLSVWEISANRSPGTKADHDWEKRSTTPDGSPPADATYVQLILRPWTNRGTWATARRAEGKWKDVRAYGLDDVETWLETAPVTWAWFSELLNLDPYGLRSVDKWWRTWADQTDPALSPEVVLAGRAEEIGKFDSALKASGIVTVQSASQDDVCAFVAARAIKAEEAGDDGLSARLAFVSEIATWRQLLESSGPLVLVALDPEFAKEVPATSPHTVVVPILDASTADIELPPLDASSVKEALIASGMDDDERADEAGRLARRSITALRRRLARKAELHQPAWARTPVPRLARGVLLAGRWREDSEADRDRVSELVGKPYDEAREDLAALAATEDPFIARIGSAIHLVSAVDAWILLGTRLTVEDVRAFSDLAVLVLSEVDPALELPDGERWWRAGVEGVGRAHSAELRRGVAQSLALLGAYGDSIGLSDGSTGAEWAEATVRQILAAANEDASGRTWQSLDGVMTWLAEAGPDSFCRAVATACTGEPPVAIHLFTDQTEQGLSSHSQHSDLLWALETLAWSPTYFGTAIDLLARLDQIDPGGRLSNRPIGSLTSILRPWHPDTSVNAEGRMRAFDAVRRRHPDTAWRLGITLMPESHGVHFPTRSPAFRQWKPSKTSITMGEYGSWVSELVERLLEDADYSAPRWLELFDRYSSLHPQDRAKTREALAAVVAEGRFTAEGRVQLWTDLHELLGRHREFADAQWALPEEEVVALDDIIKDLAPQDAEHRLAWLFDDWRPFLGDASRREDYAAYDTLLNERRRGAMVEIEREGGLDAVRRLAKSVKVSQAVGIALGAASSDYDRELLPLLVADDPLDVELSSQYFSQRFRQDGWDWLTAVMSEQTALTPVQRARLLLATGDFPRAWEEAETDAAVAQEFWTRFLPFGLGSDFSRVVFVAERLQSVGRNAMSLDFMSMYSHNRDEGLDPAAFAKPIAQGLEGLLTGGDSDPEIRALSSHDFETLIGLLERHRELVGIDQVAHLEWAYLPALGYDASVPTLSESLARDPASFAEIVYAAYGRRADEEAPEADEAAEEERRKRASNAFRLLSVWNVPPGLAEDGRMDASLLSDWYSAAMEKLAETGRESAGQDALGRVLASTPPDDDGTWPGEVVREFLEIQQSSEIESGLFIELLNRRGATTRGLEDGGAQEQALVERYTADAERLSDEAPRTAAVLRDIAKSYAREARRNDRSAERFKRGLE